MYVRICERIRQTRLIVQAVTAEPRGVGALDMGKGSIPRGGPFGIIPFQHAITDDRTL